MYWQSGGATGASSPPSTSSSTRSIPATGKPIPTFGSGGPHRSARGPRPRSGRRRACALTTPGRHLQGSAHRRRPRRRSAAALAGRHPRLRRPHAARCAGRSTRFRIPASSATTPGRSARGNTRGGANNWAGMALDERTRHRLRPDRIGGLRFLRRQPPRRQSFANSPARARRRHRQARLALPGRPPRHLGPRLPVAADPGDGHARRPDGSTPSRRPPSRATSSCSIAPPASRCFRSSIAGIRRARCRRGRQPERSRCPLKPAPFARQRAHRGHADHAHARKRTRGPSSSSAACAATASSCPSASTRQTVVFPGFDGGAEWGGAAFDPDSGLLYVNANEMAWTAQLGAEHGRPSGKALYLQNCATCHRDDRRGHAAADSVAGRHRPRERSADDRRRHPPGRRPHAGLSARCEQTRGRRDRAVHAAPAKTRRRPPADALRPRIAIKNSTASPATSKFLDPDGYPAVAPPWGTLNAINLNTGEYALEDSARRVSRSWRRKGMKDTGSENYGGPVVTAGGLVFIGATNFDRKFRAFDKATGKLLWETTLPSSGQRDARDLRGRRPAVRRHRRRRRQVAEAAPAAFTWRSRCRDAAAALLPWVTPDSWRPSRRAGGTRRIVLCSPTSNSCSPDRCSVW